MTTETEFPWSVDAKAQNDAGFALLGRPHLHYVARKGTKLILPGHVILRLRESLYEASGGRCCYCRVGMRLFCDDGSSARHLLMTIEHRHPLARGGTWKRSNLAGACDRCNAAKGDLTEDEFLPLVDAFPVEPSGQYFGKLRRAARTIQSARAREAHALASVNRL